MFIPGALNNMSTCLCKVHWDPGTKGGQSWQVNIAILWWHHRTICHNWNFLSEVIFLQLCQNCQKQKVIFFYHDFSICNIVNWLPGRSVWADLQTNLCIRLAHKKTVQRQNERRSLGECYWYSSVFPKHWALSKQPPCKPKTLNKCLIKPTY